MAEEKINLLKTLSSDKWKTIGTYRRAGLLAPLFSVYSKNSAGIGDFGDLKLLVDLCEKTGCSILQLLPMNEIGATFCPYDAISSFALEPAYVSLSAVPSADDKAIKARIERIKKFFPVGRGHIDYAIREEKRQALLDIFIAGGASAPGFKKFTESNKYWLDDLALYKVIKTHNLGKPWYEWREGYAYRDKDALSQFEAEHKKDIVFQKWIQWVLYGQFKAAKEYAASKSVLIKGDLPILISRDSADVWAHPEYFKLDFAAGSPPDMYCSKGQRWGMPTYDWDRIAADNYRYFKEKLEYAENFYDILRVDHVVGLFRIWSIPYDEPPESEGLKGSFDPPDENVWRDHGSRILSVMSENTDMLLCAEDLGMIPKACPEVLKEFGIPGNEVERWVKDWSVTHDFLAPKEYRAVSVAMLSTHDTTNWAAWWDNEAGTVDQALFIRKCRDRGIDFESVKEKLFDPKRSGHGRLRWQNIVSTKEIYVGILGKREEELMDFLDMYENTYGEKEKLWVQFKLKGAMREKCDTDIITSALNITLSSRSIFSIELLMDYLYLADVFKGDPYQYRINVPGTIAKTNWSLVLPLSLEELLKHKVAGKIEAMVEASDRRVRKNRKTD
ncbi:MAG: 4-alpha-glucanotransferase [Candidatus Omnitrophica bacterium]|nr:4-alpha-glucanotransferase [Candidatus Omnitrophota bacterium]